MLPSLQRSGCSLQIQQLLLPEPLSGWLPHRHNVSVGRVCLHKWWYNYCVMISITLSHDVTMFRSAPLQRSLRDPSTCLSSEPGPEWCVLSWQLPPWSGAHLRLRWLWPESELPGWRHQPALCRDIGDNLGVMQLPRRHAGQPVVSDHILESGANLYFVRKIWMVAMAGKYWSLSIWASLSANFLVNINISW